MKVLSPMSDAPTMLSYVQRMQCDMEGGHGYDTNFDVSKYILEYCDMDKIWYRSNFGVFVLSRC